MMNKVLLSSILDSAIFGQLLKTNCFKTKGLSHYTELIKDAILNDRRINDVCNVWYDGVVVPTVVSKSYWCECENLQYTESLGKVKTFFSIHFYNSGGFWNVKDTARVLPDHIKIHRYTELPIPPEQ